MKVAKAARIRQVLAEADFVVIGASNGLDMAEGLNIFRDDAHFWEAYGDLAQRDGISCILAGISAADVRVRERWAERFFLKECLEYEPGPLMAGLRGLTQHADTFVITCNIDGHFAKAGFDGQRILETEGNISTTVDEQLLAHPSAQVVDQLDELTRLMRTHRGGSVVILELGVGLRNGVIKHMLAGVANACEHVSYIIFNYSQAVLPDARCETIVVDGDMAAAFEEVMRCRL